MKPLLVLAAVVVLLVAAWLVMIAGSSSSQGPAKLIVPSDPQDKNALIRSAHQLWKATPDYFDPVDVQRYLAMLAGSLDESQWRVVSAPAMFAWEHQRKVVPLRASLTATDKVLIPRWARDGSIPDLEALIRIANERSFDATLIEDALTKVVGVPVPSTGYDGSRHSEVVAATLRSGDLKRAKSYLLGLTWSPGTSEALREPVARLRAVLDLCEQAEGGKVELPQVVGAWQGQARDSIGRTAIRPLLEDLALRQLGSALSTATDILSGIESSATLEGARDYWGRVLSRFMPQCLDGNEVKIQNLAALARAHGRLFALAGFTFELFAKAGAEVEKMDPKDPLRAARLLEISLESAPSDADRVTAARRAVVVILKALEFGRARACVESALAKTSDPEARKALQVLLEEVKRKEASDGERVAKVQVEIERQRTQNRLTGYRERLAAAKKAGRPKEELDSLQHVISLLEKEITE